MKPEYRDSWTRDDDALAREFAEVSDAWGSDSTPIPPIPINLDREIRKFAQQRPAEELQRNWLFGKGPQLVMVVVIFFAIAMAFVLGGAEQEPVVTEPAEQLKKPSAYQEHRPPAP